MALKKLAESAKKWDVAPNEIIIHEGDKPDSFYIIQDGLFDVIKLDHPTGHQHIITTLTKNALIGEVSLIDSLPRSAMVRAKTSGVLFCFPFSAIEQLSKDHPQDYLRI